MNKFQVENVLSIGIDRIPIRFHATFCMVDLRIMQNKCPDAEKFSKTNISTTCSTRETQVVLTQISFS